MKAINYYIIIEKIKEAPKKVGGIELTEKQDTDIRYLKAKVISVGNKIEGIKENDIIRYDMINMQVMVLNGRITFIM